MVAANRKPGTPHEAFVYEYTEKVGRTWKRRVIGNYCDGNLEYVLCNLPSAFYRLEWRDRRRWIVKAESIYVTPEGEVERVDTSQRRARRRKVPPPVSIRGLHQARQHRRGST